MPFGFMKTRLPAIGIALLLLPCAALAWSGDTWGNITRATIQSKADMMIDSTWMPKNTFTNFQYGSTYYTYTKGVTYTGVAYSQNNPQENWSEFYSAVTNTSGGSVGYGNDCSGFVSICWKLPARETTALSRATSAPTGSAWEPSAPPPQSLSCWGMPLITPRHHIIMFLNYESGGIRSMEQTPNNAQRKVWSYSGLANYRPIRRLQIIEDRGISLSGNLAFGSVPVGTSAQRTLTINSTGTSTLTVTNLTLPAGFSGNWSGTIAAGGSQNVAITFSPTALTSYSGSLAVSSDATEGTNTLAVSGTGTSQAPQITAQPLSQTNLAGSSVTLSVTASGTEPLRYRWQGQGTNYPPGTNAFVTTLAGDYSVVVSNVAGMVTSAVATVVFTNPPPAQPGHFDSICRRADGTVQLNMSGTAGSNYILQCSSDWVVWSNLCTLSGVNGLFGWVDPCATNSSQRFYRLRLGP